MANLVHVCNERIQLECFKVGNLKWDSLSTRRSTKYEVALQPNNNKHYLKTACNHCHSGSIIENVSIQEMSHFKGKVFTWFIRYLIWGPSFSSLYNSTWEHFAMAELGFAWYITVDSISGIFSGSGSRFKIVPSPKQINEAIFSLLAESLQLPTK